MGLAAPTGLFTRPRRVLSRAENAAEDDERAGSDSDEEDEYDPDYIDARRVAQDAMDAQVGHTPHRDPTLRVTPRLTPR